MSDTQAAMREFRFLDDKRKGGGLSHIEEQRWIDLGGMLGMTAQQGYYGEDGLWYAYPPGYDPHTGQYYQPPQSQYGGHAPPQQQPYYDPNAQYSQPQPEPAYDPNAQYYDPNQGGYDAGYDPNAYAPPAPQPYQPAPAWTQNEHPQQQAEWPQNYDPNLGQYVDPNTGYPIPSPSQPLYVPPSAPTWQTQMPIPAPQPMYDAPAPVAAEEDGPLEVAEDEVMEVTDDDVTLLDSSAPLAAPLPALAPAPAEDPLGALRSSLSFDEPEPTRAPEPAAQDYGERLPRTKKELPKTPAEHFRSFREQSREEQPQTFEPAPLLDVEPEPIAEEPLPPTFAPAPLLDVPVDVEPEPIAEEPLPPTFEPAPLLDIPVDVEPEPIAAVAEPVAYEPVPIAAIEPELPVDLANAPTLPLALPQASAPAPLLDIPVDVEPEPIAAVAEPVAHEPLPIAAIEPELPPLAVETPSILVDDDLGAESFAVPVLEAPAAPLALTMVAPSSATTQDLYPDGIPEPIAPPPPPPAPVSFDLDTPAIPDPRPSIPISIHVEEPVEESALDVEPLLEASVDPEPPQPIPAPELPSFEASFDDIPVEHEPEPPPSTHTGFEASLADLPPEIADAPPPPIIDVELMAAAPIAVMDFDVSIDDKPLPIEATMDFSGDAGEKLELAKTSDFLSFPTSSAAETSNFSSEGESLVESGTLATMANPGVETGGRASIELPPEEPDAGVPLANNADFLGMTELNSTGQAWTKDNAGISFEEEPQEAEIEEEPGDIIQGVALEDDSIDAEIQAELAEAVIEPEPWPAPLAIPPPPAVFSPPPPAAARLPTPAPFVPAPPPPRPSQPAFDPPGRDRSLFDTSGSNLREDPSAPEIRGEHRVILHTVEGQVKRGVLRDTKLDDETVGLEAQPGAIERIARPRIKAIFFMLPAGVKAPAPTGDKLRVTFKDGRQLAGFSSDHRGSGLGFFVVPADNRTNTERIFIYRASVEKVAVD